jgi:uncharacterized damage-inducible protein DinB
MNAERGDVIAQRLRRTVHGPMWHGDALLEQLRGVSAAAALRHPLPGAHSVWELVLHITAWATIAHERATGVRLGDPTAAEDWPAVPARASAAAWRDAVTAMTGAYERLAAFAAGLDETALAAQVPGRDYTLLTMLAGVVEHGVYHGGQIGILKRAARG